jgi:hypothetical protein
MRQLFALFVLCSPAFAGGLLDQNDKAIDDFTLDLEGRYWFAQLSGEVKADTSSRKGTHIDFPDELGIEKPAGPLFEFLGRARLKKIQFRAAYFQAKFEETKRLEKTIRFKDLTFNVNTKVDAEAKFRFAAIDAEFLLVDAGSSKEIGFELAIGIGGRYLRFDGRIENDLTGVDEDVSRTGLLPVVSAFASVSFLNCFRIDAEASAMHIGGFFPKISGTFIDASIEARVYLISFVYIAGGYRFIMAEAKWDSSAKLELETRLQGFYVGVGVCF